MKKYGIIGRPLGHSFSKRYFEQKFEKEGLRDCVFENYELSEIAEVSKLIQDPFLEGFCITIPYKKEILAYLDEATEAVKSMQACNCVKITDGKLKGFNTDVIGFERSFSPLLRTSDKKALILGTGGAAAAVCYALKELGIDYTFVSRHPQAGQLSYEAAKDPAILADYPIIINCSPVGTFPKEAEAPDIAYELLSDQHYLFDLVYNPPLTRFLAEGQARGARIQNGYPMLEIQAEQNWKNWNS